MRHEVRLRCLASTRCCIKHFHAECTCSPQAFIRMPIRSRDSETRHLNQLGQLAEFIRVPIRAALCEFCVAVPLSVGAWRVRKRLDLVVTVQHSLRIPGMRAPAKTAWRCERMTTSEVAGSCATPRRITPLPLPRCVEGTLRWSTSDAGRLAQGQASMCTRHPCPELGGSCPLTQHWQ